MPIFIPVPFRELSSVQYFSLEEQLTELTAALKEQYGRHCFIKIHDQKTQPLRVPFIKTYRTSTEAICWYENRKLEAEGAHSCASVDTLIAQQDADLQQEFVGASKKTKVKVSAAVKSVNSTDEPWSELIGRE